MNSAKMEIFVDELTLTLANSYIKFTVGYCFINNRLNMMTNWYFSLSTDDCIDFTRGLSFQVVARLTWLWYIIINSCHA